MYKIGDRLGPPRISMYKIGDRLKLKNPSSFLNEISTIIEIIGIYELPENILYRVKFVYVYCTQDMSEDFLNYFYIIESYTHE